MLKSGKMPQSGKTDKMGRTALKEKEWDEPLDDRKELFDAGAPAPEEELAPETTAFGSEARITKLRRRIEERLDSKRIALEFAYDELDDLPDILQ